MISPNGSKSGNPNLIQNEMVFFAVSKAAVSKLLHISLAHTHHPWVSGGVLEQRETDELRASGISVSVFNHKVDPDNVDTMTHALDVIREHHPSEVIWSEIR